jgi:hypothetical protein
MLPSRGAGEPTTQMVGRGSRRAVTKTPRAQESEGRTWMTLVRGVASTPFSLLLSHKERSGFGRSLTLPGSAGAAFRS